jgi:hypothetical protein
MICPKAAEMAFISVFKSDFLPAWIKLVCLLMTVTARPNISIASTNSFSAALKSSFSVFLTFFALANSDVLAATSAPDDSSW